MWALRLKMWLLVSALFAFIFAILTVIGTQFLHIGGFYFYLGLSLVMMFIQYMAGPKIIEWTMGVRYVKKQEYPRLFQMVEGMAIKAGIPMPKIGIAKIRLPNAFAFGRSLKDGRVCVTEGILDLLNDEELKAVLGHELTHLKSRDVITITLLSVIPMIMYHIAWQFLFYGRRRDERGGNTVLIGIAAFLFYFITSILVLYASRIREYFADKGSVELGNRPQALASSLYKLVYGAARTDKESLRQVEGLKAFFASDPSCALREIRELKDLDLDKSGTIDASELQILRNKRVNLGFAGKVMEMLSTHPNMLRRIKRLSEYKMS